MKIIQAILLLMTSMFCAHGKDYNIFCYWNTTAFYRKNVASFQAWHIDVRLCTHLGYSHFGISETGAIKMVDEHLDKKIELINQVINLRHSASKLKVFASVGGWTVDSKLMSNMAADMRKRDRFFSSVIEFLYSWHFDGLDLDWEFPTQRGGRPEDRNNFVVLLEELKIILHEHKFQLSVAVAARTDEATLAAYDIPNIVKHADLVNLITYDFDRPFGKHVAHNAPLYGAGNASSVERAVRQWVKQGGKPAKLLLGIPFFAQTYTLKQLSNTSVGAPSRGPGYPGVSTLQRGFMGYNEFCMRASKWTKKYDEEAHVPYAIKHSQWLSYEDGRSINEKLRLLKSLNLGGAMVWSIDTDDFRGNCGERFSLLRIVNAGIGDAKLLTTQAPTTEGFGMCPQDGFFRHPWFCEYYHECRDGQRFDYECINGEYFDADLGQCSAASSVYCPQNFVTWKPGERVYNFRDLPLNLKIAK
ncbi:chitinase-3-like protein 1 [Scaptodrosophila lebanonensis]|uniref:Chitinase-3-like protein 1 n=1 Tax=Drosophila lebanonensis TaxID=7225 RepID=A0A6J2UC64_DROLE|nr:chitinase-3-like protein 1 [Scaptodrosophila lebanonensis]